MDGTDSPSEVTRSPTRPADQIAGDATYSTLARHAAWYGTAGALGKTAALLAVPYLTRELGPDGYGLVDLATSFAGLLIVVLRFGADIPTMRLAAADRVDRPMLHTAYLTGTAATSLIGVVLLLPAAGFISGELWSSPGDDAVAILSLLLIPVSTVQFALVNVLRFVGRPRAFALLAALDVFAQLGLAVLLVAAGMGAVGAMAGYVAGSTLGLLGAGIAVAPFVSRRINWALIGRVLQEGFPFVPGAAAFIAADGLSRIIAANEMSVGAVGQLALAIRIASVMSLLSLAFQLAWGPFGMALAPGQASRALFGRVILALVALLTIATIGLGALAPELTALLGGEEFRDAAHLVPGLLVSAGLPAILYVMATAAGIARRGRWVAWSSLLGGLTQLAAIALLLPVFGLAGFAVGAIVGRVTSLIVLGRAISDTADLSRTAILLLVGTVGASMLLQGLTADPDQSLPWRLSVAAIATIGGGALVAVWGRTTPVFTR